MLKKFLVLIALFIPFVADKFEEMASEAVRTSNISTRAYVKLQSEDVVKLFEMCK